jgi:peptidoglycan/xylan/chitin deacetylase (PgdA/CDA1 family)
MSNIEKIPLIWSNDDIRCGLKQSMQRQLDFLSNLGIPGTFFVVPCWVLKNEDNRVQRLTEDPPLIDLLQSATRAGHDVVQHSTTHVCYENGLADMRMFDLMGEQTRINFSKHRFVLERLWQLDAMEAQIGWGLSIWKEAFGHRSQGYRPGCGAFCGNMYRALENLGFSWCSARLVSMTGWMWAANRNDYPFQWDGPARPFLQGRITEFPILDDVAFRIPRARGDRFVELGWQHWQECLRRRAPFILVSHFFGLEHDEGAGFEIHDKLLRRILATGQAQPLTMSEYHRQLHAGHWPWAEKSECYPQESDLPTWHALGQAAKVPATQGMDNSY